MDALRISTLARELNVPLIHHFLSQESTWARDIPLETVARALQNSLCFSGCARARKTPGDSTIYLGHEQRPQLVCSLRLHITVEAGNSHGAILSGHLSHKALSMGS
jgi:hypothetical protein